MAEVIHITPREREVLAGILAGKKLDCIAADLGVSRSTVKFHLLNLRQKTGTHCLVEDVIFFARRPNLLASYTISQLMLPL